MSFLVHELLKHFIKFRLCEPRSHVVLVHIQRADFADLLTSDGCLAYKNIGNNPNIPLFVDRAFTTFKRVPHHCCRIFCIKPLSHDVPVTRHNDYPSDVQFLNCILGLHVYNNSPHLLSGYVAPDLHGVHVILKHAVFISKPARFTHNMASDVFSNDLVNPSHKIASASSRFFI